MNTVDAAAVYELGYLEVERNFVKAISLSSLIHPNHEVCPINRPSRQGPQARTSLLSLARVHDILHEVCIQLQLSIDRLQYL